MCGMEPPAFLYELDGVFTVAQAQFYDAPNDLYQFVVRSGGPIPTYGVIGEEILRTMGIRVRDANLNAMASWDVWNPRWAPNNFEVSIKKRRLLIEFFPNYNYKFRVSKVSGDLCVSVENLESLLMY